jgi:hypothetical protein
MVRDSTSASVGPMTPGHAPRALSTGESAARSRYGLQAEKKLKEVGYSNQVKSVPLLSLPFSRKHLVLRY